MRTQDGLAELLRIISAEFGGDPEPPRVVAQPGQTTTADWCAGACWSVYVRLDTLFPSKAFPAPDTTPTNCGAPLAARWHVGAWRCVASLDEQGEPPDALTQTEDAAGIMDDADRLRCAILTTGLWPPRRMLLGAWTPVGPFGGCAGGYWPLTTWQIP